MNRLCAPFVILALLACGCASGDDTPEANGAIQRALSSRPPSGVNADAWKSVKDFYAKRQSAPAWIDDKHPSRRAAEALVAIQAAAEHGFDPESYGASEIVKMHDALEQSDTKAPDRLDKLAAFDVRITTALLALGRDVAVGRTSPQSITSTWKRQRTSPDLAGTLDNAVDGDLKDWLNSVAPPHAEYAALKKAYNDLRGQQDKGGWARVPAGVFRRGHAHPSVVALRQRLVASGQLKDDEAAHNSPVYDDNVVAAVKAFQELHAIKATGNVDGPTLAALNVPIDERLRQVAINMERWRWTADDLGARHFLVNIPYFHLIARENGKPVMDIRVVVGKPGNETPIFSDEMEFVVFSPYWNIPDSIKVGETAPAVARDPGYLARNNIEILRVSKHGAHQVDPAQVDWSNPAELRELAFRQRPGAQNALGHVKFLFPNDYDVYLHDTPADSLFQRTGRAFSHGCIRVEEPEALAKYVLRDYSEWDQPRILNAMHAGVEKHVKLKEAIPVHITYFTSWVDEAGGLHFQPDIYGYDRKQAR